MSAEESRDFRLAVIVLLTALFLGFFIGRASACDSYEDCQEKAKVTTMGGQLNVDACAYALKAIAYKLDEISKKLDHPEDKYVNVGGPVLLKKSDLDKGRT